jgi:hypothetical protein
VTITTPIRLGTAISMRFRNIVSMNAIPYVAAYSRLGRHGRTKKAPVLGISGPAIRTANRTVPRRRFLRAAQA